MLGIESCIWKNNIECLVRKHASCYRCGACPTAFMKSERVIYLNSSALLVMLPHNMPSQYSLYFSFYFFFFINEICDDGGPPQPKIYVSSSYTQIQTSWPPWWNACIHIFHIWFIFYRFHSPYRIYIYIQYTYFIKEFSFKSENNFIEFLAFARSDDELHEYFTVWHFYHVLNVCLDSKQDK